MTDTESDWPDDPSGRSSPPPLLLVLGAALVVQTVLLAWARVFPTGPMRPPTFVPPLVVVLSGVAAVAVIVDARSAGGWWQPRWPFWAAGTLFFGINLGVGLAYYLRRQEALTTTEPEPRWKWPTVAAAVLAGVATMVYNVFFESPTESLPTVVGIVLLAAVGFGFGASLFDLQYVTSALEGTGVGWVMDGYHWPIMLMVLIPANLLFVLLYLYQRRRLFSRARQADPGPGTVDAAADGAGETERRDDIE